MTVSVKRIDRGYLKIQAAVKALNKSPAYVKAGVLGKSKPRNDGALTNAQLATIHEFGTSRIPARPFIQPAFLKHRAEYMAILEKLTRRYLGGPGMHYTQVLHVIGLKMASDMKQFVTGGPEIKPTNAESTKRIKEAKRAKGNTADVRTLVDTGRMVASITYEVVGGIGGAAATAPVAGFKSRLLSASDIAAAEARGDRIWRNQYGTWAARKK